MLRKGFSEHRASGSQASSSRAAVEYLKYWFLGIGVLALVGATLWPTSVVVADAWLHNIDYSHAALVVLVSTYLISIELRQSKEILVSPSLWLVALTCFLSVVWAIAYVTATQIVQMICLVGLAYCALLIVAGASRWSRFIVPVGVLLSTVPIWGVLVPVLQAVTINVNAYFLSLLGWSAFIAGDVVYVPSGTFEIARGCSGAHFFVVGTTIGALYAHVNLTTPAMKILFVALAALTSLVANWMRVLALVIIGDVTDMRHTFIADGHYFFGWAVFTATLFPLFWIGMTMQKHELARESASRSEAESGTSSVSSRKMNRARLALVSLAFVFPATIVSIASFRVDSYDNTVVELPPSIGMWKLSGQTANERLPLPEFTGARTEALASYTNRGRAMSVYANLYVGQSRGAELVAYGNRWYPAEWTVSSSEMQRSEVQGRTLSYIVEHLNIGDAKAVMARTYIVGGKTVTSDTRAKLVSAIEWFVGSPVSGAFAVTVACDTSCDAAVSDLERFVETAIPVVIRETSSN